MHHASQFLLGLRRAAAAACALLCLALPLTAQGGGERSPLERRHWAETRARYAQQTWPHSEVRQGLPTALELPGYAADALQSDAGMLTRAYRPADRPDAAPVFVLETYVADTTAAAQERLVGWLAGLQSDHRMPALAELGIAAGDVGFAGRSGAGPRALAWIAFVRGNVAVRISAFDAPRTPELDLAALAVAVDAAALGAPAQLDGGAPPKPVIRQFSAPRAAAVAGEVLRLAVSVEDPAQGAPHLQWVVGGPGQGYVEQDADGTWALHTTGPGRLTLALEVTASNGTFARQELQFTLSDD